MANKNLNKAIVIGGPTASGKSALALAKAEQLDGIVINADSMQVYLDLNVLTARPDKEAMNRASHKLYGFMSGEDVCTASKWADLAAIEMQKAWWEGKIPIIVGGTGLYIKSLMDGFSPIPDIPLALQRKVREEAEISGLDKIRAVLADKDNDTLCRFNDPHRLIRAYEVLLFTGKSMSEWQKEPKVKIIKAEWEKIFVNPDRENLYARCNARFLHMIENGAIEETKSLIEKNYPADVPVLKALGVPEIAAYLRQDISKDEMIAKAQQATRNYAKRQVTWFSHQF